jgi:hypothetical protein
MLQDAVPYTTACAAYWRTFTCAESAEPPVHAGSILITGADVNSTSPCSGFPTSTMAELDSNDFRLSSWQKRETWMLSRNSLR